MFIYIYITLYLLSIHPSMQITTSHSSLYYVNIYLYICIYSSNAMKEILSNVYHYNQQDEKMNGGGSSLLMMPLRYIDSEFSIMDDTIINYHDLQHQHHYNNINTAAATTAAARKKLTSSRSSQSLSPSIRNFSNTNLHNHNYNNNMVGTTATSSLLITPFTGVRPSSAVSALSSASSTAALPMNYINTNTNVINLKKSKLNMSTSSSPFSAVQNNHNSNNTTTTASTVQGIAIHTPSHQLTSSSAAATSNTSALRKSTNTFSNNSLLLYPSTHSSTILNSNNTTNNNNNNNYKNTTNVYNVNNKSTATPIIRNLSSSSIMKIPTTSSFQGNSFEISNNEAKNIYYAHYNGLEV